MDEWDGSRRKGRERRTRPITVRGEEKQEEDRFSTESHQ